MKKTFCLLASLLAGSVNAGLIAEYTFDGNSLDSSGNNEHLTLYNGASYSSGYTGQALVLDGINDYAHVNIGNYGLTNFTVEAWINVPTYSDNLHYVSLQQDNYIVLGDYGSGPISTWAAGLSPIDAGNAGPVETTPSINEWHHIAFSFDGVNQNIFLNGVLEKSIFTTGSLISSASYNSGLSIGARYSQNTQFVTGAIDNVRIHDVALSVGDLGFYRDNVQVPEPASLALIGLGLAGLGFARKRKKT